MHKSLDSRNPLTDFLSSSIREFKRLKDYADKSISRLDDAQFFQQLDSESNSIAIIVKHLSGNMKSRWTDFLTTDGEKPFRDRDQEFELHDGNTRLALLEDWEKAWTIFLDTLTKLRESDLSRTITIRGEQHSVVEAIVRQIPHYGFHVGQIVILAKHLAGPSWQSLSIAKGQSSSFNKDPKTFLEK